MKNENHLHVKRTRLSAILSALGGEAEAAMRVFIQSVKPTIDASGEDRVVRHALACLSTFRASLPASSPMLDELHDRLARLERAIVDLNYPEVGLLNETAWRQLWWRPQWALFQLLGESHIPDFVRCIVGAELARSLTLGKQFDRELASGLRRHIVFTAGAPGQTITGELGKKAESILRFASAMFGPGGMVEAGMESVDAMLRRFFHGRIKFANNREHQGILDARCMTSAQVTRATFELRQAVEAGDDGALLLVLAVCTGLPLSIVPKLVLLSHVAGDWSAVVDAEAGLFKMSLRLIVPDMAKPSEGAQGLVTSTDILVRPFPQFCRDALVVRATRWPTAATIDALLPNLQRAKAVGLGNKAKGVELAPTPSRLLNSIGRFALGLGQSRLLATFATGDFRLVPRSKLHYAVVRRDDVWSASAQLYEALGWGATTAVEFGPAIGSQVTPTRETVGRWWNWMAVEAAGHYPGPRAGYDRLIQHHNVFGRAVSSIAVLLLAMRARKVIEVPAFQRVGDGWVVQIQDKRVGPFPHPDPVPLCATLKAQLDLWRSHCAAVDVRLARLGMSTDTRLRARLQAESKPGATASFFVVGEEGNPNTVSSADLVAWWPPAFGLEPNFGRHFAETNLPGSGLLSREIDAFVRHHQRGMFAWTNDSDFILAEWVKRCSDAIELLMKALGCRPIPGLGGKEKRQ